MTTKITLFYKNHVSVEQNGIVMIWSQNYMSCVRTVAGPAPAGVTFKVTHIVLETRNQEQHKILASFHL